MKAIVGARIFSGDQWFERHALVIDGETIVGICPQDALSPTLSREHLPGGMLVPGFIDAQVNGGGGVMFNQAPQLSTLRTMASAHRRFGTVAMLPTLISDSPEQSQLAISATEQAIEHGCHEILGVHLEGPHLSTAKRGAHHAHFLRELNRQDLAMLTEPGHGIRLLTLSPDRASLEQIAALRTHDVRVAVGHSNVDFKTASAAFAAGATGVTHLFNAMSPLTSREPGVVGAALLDPDCWCGVIVDGHHVHPGALQLALKAKPRGKLYLVTDAMGTIGAEQPWFDLYGERIEESGGVLRNQEGNLAGAAISMIDAVRNTVELLELELEEALRMASRYPAEFLGVDNRLGSLQAGYDASFVYLSEQLDVCATWVKGQAAYYENKKHENKKA